MPEFRSHHTAALLQGIAVDPAASVPLERVVRQRAAFAELYGATLLQPSLDVLLDDACRVAAQGSEAPLAKILEHQPGEHQFLVRAGFGWKPGVVGHARAADDPSNPAGESLAIRRPVTVDDVRQRKDYHLPPIYAEHHIVASSNVPILGVAGFYGVLEIDRRENKPFDTLDTTFLASIAGILADAIERVRRYGALQAALDARALLLREHHHRVRNSYQTIVARLERHAQQSTTEDSRRRFQDVQRRVFALAALYDHLIGTGEPGGRFDFASYLGDLCARMRGFYAVGDRSIELFWAGDQADIGFDLDVCTALGIVINELVANAVEHAFAAGGGHIEVRLSLRDGRAFVTVADDGSGLPQDRPESTGLSVAKNLVAGIGGSISATSDRGTTWTIMLPPTDGTRTG